MGQSKLRMCESRKRVELARFIWKWMFWNVWKWMFGSCYSKVDVWNVWKWMFGSCYLKVNVRNVWKDKLKLKILTTECYLFLIARLPHIEDLTNIFKHSIHIFIQCKNICYVVKSGQRDALFMNRESVSLAPQRINKYTSSEFKESKYTAVFFIQIRSSCFA